MASLELKNLALLGGCKKAVSWSFNAQVRKLDSLLSIPDGHLTNWEYSPVVKTLIEAVIEVIERSAPSASRIRFGATKLHLV